MPLTAGVTAGTGNGLEPDHGHEGERPAGNRSVTRGFVTYRQATPPRQFPTLHSQHLPGTVSDQLIQQRPRRTSRRLLRSFLSNYREHGRTFPTGVRSPALLEEPDGTSGRYALQAPQPEISHPQVPSIPPVLRP